MSLLQIKWQQTFITCDACMVFSFCVSVLVTECNETVYIVEYYLCGRNSIDYTRNCMLNVNNSSQLSKIFLAWQLHQVIQMHQHFWAWLHFHHLWKSGVFEPPNTSVSPRCYWILSLWDLETYIVQVRKLHVIRSDSVFG